MKIGLTVYLETTLSRGHGLKHIQFQWYHRKKPKQGKIIEKKPCKQTPKKMKQIHANKYKRYIYL